MDEKTERAAFEADWRAQNNNTWYCENAWIGWQARAVMAEHQLSAKSKAMDEQKERAAEPLKACAHDTLERAAGMLSAYAEIIKATGRYAEEHYIPEVEWVASELRAALAATPAPHPDTADAERYRKLVASGKYTAASIGGGWGLSCGGARWTKAELDAAADALPSVRAQAQKGE